MWLTAPRPRLLPLCASLGLLGLCSQALGQAAKADAQQVEVSAQPLTDTEQRRRDPVAKAIYGREELDKYGDTNLSDVLKRLPGVNVSGGNPRMRGLGAGYTLILVNGEPAPPGFSMDNLSPAQVERIEVSKGPTAEHSAQAVAGTINIILREAPRTRQQELRIGLGYSAVRPTASFTATLGDRQGALSYSLPLSAFQWRGAARGWGERQTLDVQGQPLQTLSHSTDDYWGQGWNFSPRLSWKLGEADNVNWQSFFQHGNFHNASHSLLDVQRGLPPISVDDRSINGGMWENLRSNVQWVRRWADGSRIDLKLGLQTNRSAYRTDVDGDDAQGQHTLTRVATGDNRERGASSTGKYARPLWDQHSLALGWDVEQRHRRETRSVIDNQVPQLLGFDGEPFAADVQRAALYLQDEWELSPQWSTYLGLRTERIASQSVGTGETLRGQYAVVTPLWHVHYKLDAKARDVVRASLTRSFKAPDLNALLGRPSINGSYPTTVQNTVLSPDRVGNPALKPELAIGLDIAFEKYLAQGGLVSLGVFHRRIDGLIRNMVTQGSVSWSTQQRWVSRPVNLAQARSTGIEVEIKGRAGELMPSLVEPAMALNLRASFSAYRSTVDGLPGPDKGLEQQQPWSATAGFDHVFKAIPLTLGASMSYSPAYAVQQTLEQRNALGRNRSVDVYGLWAFDKQTSLRVSANNLAPPDTYNRTDVVSGTAPVQTSTTWRSNRPNLGASLTLKF